MFWTPVFVRNNGVTPIVYSKITFNPRTRGLGQFLGARVEVDRRPRIASN